MLYLIFTSLVGLIIISRILSLLEKSKLFSRQKILVIALFFLIPIYFFSIFKDPNAILTTYIGIILGLLIFKSIFFRFYIFFVYEKCHLRFVDHVIFNLKSGFSPLKCIENAVNDMNGGSRELFRVLFLNSSNAIVVISELHPNILAFKREFETILGSKSHLVDRLRSFRSGLKLIINLRHKSRQASQQSRLQALISLVIYCGLFFISWHEFKLYEYPRLIILSVIWMSFGIFLVFKLGGSIKWRI